MDSDSESSNSEGEVNDLMREAANCDYVNNLYNSNYKNKAEVKKKSKIAKVEDCEDEPTLSSHQIFLSKSLSKKLDGLIKIVTVDEKLIKRKHKETIQGIQLLKDSVFIPEPEMEEKVSKVKRISREKPICEEEKKSLVHESAVTPEWVLSKSNTALWRFYKPKVIYAKAEQISDNKIVYSITQTTF